jgi:hypothetical protein
MQKTQMGVRHTSGRPFFGLYYAERSTETERKERMTGPIERLPCGIRAQMGPMAFHAYGTSAKPSRNDRGIIFGGVDWCVWVGGMKQLTLATTGLSDTAKRRGRQWLSPRWSAWCCGRRRASWSGRAIRNRVMATAGQGRAPPLSCCRWPVQLQWSASSHRLLVQMRYRGSGGDCWRWKWRWQSFTLTLDTRSG